MDTAASNKFLFIFILSYIFMVCSSGWSFLSKRELFQTSQHDTMYPPFTTSPVTNPVTTPATGVTVPPAIFPVTPTFPGGGEAVPVPVAGQSWCVARSGVAETALQVALDYACGMGGADCSGIQQGATCYNPSTLQNHASYAFNAYYQKNPLQTSCDFGGAAMLTTVNPSSGSCVFPTSSPATVSPTTTTTTTPTMPAPATDFSSGAAPAGTGTPPTVLNASNPALGVGSIGGYGETPPTASISSASATTAGFIACIILPLSTILHGRL